MYDESRFRERLSSLRIQKGVSARDMSLSIGQNASYINRIENGIALPSMQVFLYICEYLKITPKEFFEEENSNPQKIQLIVKELKQLTGHQLDALLEFIRAMK